MVFSYVFFTIFFDYIVCSLFVPKNVEEEALLLLLIAELQVSVFSTSEKYNIYLVSAKLM